MPDVGPIRFSGFYLIVGGVGSLLIVAALKNVSPADFVRSLVKLRPLQKNPSDVPTTDPSGAGGGQAQGAFHDFTAAAGPAGTPLGTAVANDALSYVGKVPYKWAGADPSGWDCSGAVSYILHHDNGIDIPDALHTTASQFYSWSGATTIHSKDAAAGDLACWPTHVGIMVDNTHMVNAPTFGTMTRVDDLSKGWPPAVIRRPKAYGATAPVKTTVRGD